MKAASHVPKTYMVKVAGNPTGEGLGRLREGISIPSDRGKRVRTAPAKIRVIRESANPWYEVTLIEGKNRQIRRMFEEIGHHVEKIKRVRYGPLELDVHPGKFRKLTVEEVTKLKVTRQVSVGAGVSPGAASASVISLDEVKQLNLPDVLVRSARATTPAPTLGVTVSRLHVKIR